MQQLATDVPLPISKKSRQISQALVTIQAV